MIRKNYKGFTLVEILVVIAITVILMGLLMIPLYKTLETNRMTAAYTNAQQNSRQAMLQIRQDISNAMFVLESSSTPVLLPVRGYVDEDGNSLNKPAVLQYACINLIMPKTEFYCSDPNHPDNKPRNFPRGEGYKSSSKELAINECPYCHSDEYVKITPCVPVEQGSTVVRYFLGLKDNGTSSDPLMTCADVTDLSNWTTCDDRGWTPDDGNSKFEDNLNPVILYRVEFDPKTDDYLFPAELSLAGLDPDSKEYKSILDQRMCDPNVFYHPDCCSAWAGIVQNVGMIEGQDLVVASDEDYIDGVPCKVKNSVTFTPATISAETPIANSSSVNNLDAQTAAPTTFKTKYTMWGGSAKVTLVRPNPTTQYPDKKWILKSVYNQNYNFANVYKIGNTMSLNPVLNASDIVFDADDYLYNKHYIENYDTEMAFTYDEYRGSIEFALQPKKVSINDNIDSDNLLYYPELEVYGYKFMKYKNATVVPGSEKVVYYNAYWVDSNGYSFVDKGYNYSDMETNVDRVVYQRSPFSIGQLNYNQYKIDYEEGTIYWKPLLEHNVNGGIYPVKNIDIPEIENFSIQFNKPGDKLTISYLTNEVIDVNLNIRMIYDTYKNPRSSTICERVIVGNSIK